MKVLKIFLVIPIILALIFLGGFIASNGDFDKTLAVFTSYLPIPTPTITSTPIIKYVYEPTLAITKSPPAPTTKPNNANNNEEWGVAKQISEHTFVQQVASDARMATVEEIFTALNNYRNNYGKGSLSWNGDLASWANSRAITYANNGSLDEHAGFFGEAESKGNQYNLSSMNEGSSYIGKLEATHYVEWILAGDAPHKEALLRDTWNTVGVGLASNDGVNFGIDIIYGRTR